MTVSSARARARARGMMSSIPFGLCFIEHYVIAILFNLI